MCLETSKNKASSVSHINTFLVVFKTLVLLATLQQIFPILSIRKLKDIDKAVSYVILQMIENQVARVLKE